MEIVAIIQARMSSTRLPGKVLMDLGGKPVLENIIERISRAKRVTSVVVATSTEKADDQIAKRFNCFRGSLENVLERFYLCAKKYRADIILRFTADNALIDPELIDNAIDAFTHTSVLDYLHYKASLPLGMGIEIFTFNALERAYNEANDAECLEHVTPYIVKNPTLFKVINYKDNDEDHSSLRFTMDTAQDYEFVRCIYDYFGNNLFSYSDIIEVLKIHPEWLLINKDIIQNKVKYKGITDVSYF